MPAVPARWLGDVRRAERAGEWIVSVRDVDAARSPVGTEYDVQLRQLSNAETIKACAALSMNWRSFPLLDARFDALESALDAGAIWEPRNPTPKVLNTPGRVDVPTVHAADSSVESVVSHG